MPCSDKRVGAGSEMQSRKNGVDFRQRTHAPEYRCERAYFGIFASDVSGSSSSWAMSRAGSLCGCALIPLSDYNSRHAAKSVTLAGNGEVRLRRTA